MPPVGPRGGHALLQQCSEPRYLLPRTAGADTFRAFLRLQVGVASESSDPIAAAWPERRLPRRHPRLVSPPTALGGSGAALPLSQVQISGGVGRSREGGGG
jgi:hypothetical protein